jgi:pSer/pThr/pTyr-binding forkhead associated (FHA) protein
MGVHLRGTAPKSPTAIRPDLPSVMDSLILRALSKAPEDRYKSGSEMSANLRSAISALGGLTTQIYTREDLSIKEDGQTSAETDDYSLRIETPGQETRLVQLTRHSINIGRDADNDIVLPSGGVSRNHAHLEYQSGQWLITDHGGINGTWLNNRRLFSEEEAVLIIGSKLEIGPYVLLIEGPTPDSNEAGDTPISELPTEGRLAVAAAYSRARAETDEPLSLFLASESITVEAGQQTILNAEVVNNSNRDDRVNLQLRGLPRGWLKIQNTFSEVSSGQSAIIPLVIHPPKDARIRSGKQRFRVELQSRQHPDINLAVSGSLNIVSFEAFKVSMRPRRLKLPGRLQINIKNIGNFRNEFTVHGRDIEGIVRFRGERNHISLNPGQTAKVEMQLESRRQKLLGGSETYGFEIEISGGSGSNQVLSGTAEGSSAMPAGVLYIGIFVVAFLCVLAALFGIVRGRFFSGPTPTTISGVFPGASATAERATSVAAEAAATSQLATQLAATAAMLGDRDGDGLSDLQENVVGTDPDNQDSDNDGLLDGEEVLTWGTNPLSQDTDSDDLVDGAEVHQYGTSPTNHDTDGDGLSDGLEIITGTNPLDSIDPIPSMTFTAELPAPTQEPTPLPTNTPTDEPAPTSTISSPLPTDTPTPESTQTPTIEPTETPEYLISCTDFPPIIDGIIDASEWENGPMLSFAPEGNPQRSVQAFLDRDASSFYLGYIINDPVVDLTTDVINIAIDGNFNRDVPDGSDRLIQVLRDGTGRMQRGLGDNNNGSYWESEYQSSNWRVAVGETGDGQWVVEIAMDITEEIPDLADGGFFGYMILAGYSDILGVWPTGADLLDSSTWQTAASSACP